VNISIQNIVFIKGVSMFLVKTQTLTLITTLFEKKAEYERMQEEIEKYEDGN